MQRVAAAPTFSSAASWTLETLFRLLVGNWDCHYLLHHRQSFQTSSSFSAMRKPDVKVPLSAGER